MKTSPLNPTEFQLDALREYIGIGVGKAAATLNSLIGRHIELKVPEISIKYPEQLKSGQSDDHDLFSFVTLGFEGNLNGNASMAFDRDSAKPVSYTHLRAHETDSYLVCRLLLEKKDNL